MTSTASDRAGEISPADIATRKEFADALGRLRDQAGRTVREVAAQTGEPASTLGGYFSGRQLPPAGQSQLLPDILRACGVTDDETIRSWRRALSRVRQTPGPEPADVPAPYRGLASFQPDDAEWFFGRHELTRSAVSRLAVRWRTGAGPVVVVGPSGSGKSSLLRAGVIPIIRSRGLNVAGSQEWPILLFTPGARPLDQLASQLAAYTSSSAEKIARDLRRDPQMCAEYARQAAAPAGAGVTALVLVVDQLEEVFTECSDGTERSAFLTALHAAARPAARDSGNGAGAGTGSGSGTGTGTGSETEMDVTAAVAFGDDDSHPAAAVMLGLRADFYHRALREPALLPIVQSQVAVGPMSEAELHAAITGPAREAGLEVEDGLVEMVLRDLEPHSKPSDDGITGAHEAGALPLLSHALLVTWERRTRGRLTVADYEATGGIRGAVARTADDVFESMTQIEQEFARRLFVRLVRVGDAAPHARHRVAVAELDDIMQDLRLDEVREHRASSKTGEASDHASDHASDNAGDVHDVLDRFVERRLITVDADTVEITHEALVAAWPRLQGWLDADRNGLLIAQQLDDAARQWEAEDRDSSVLYRGSRLSAAREWFDAGRGGQPTALAREFLQASIQRERRSVRVLYRTIAVLVALLLLAVAAGAYAFQQLAEAEPEQASTGQVGDQRRVG